MGRNKRLAGIVQQSVVKESVVFARCLEIDQAPVAKGRKGNTLDYIVKADGGPFLPAFQPLADGLQRRKGVRRVACPRAVDAQVAAALISVQPFVKGSAKRDCLAVRQRLLE